MVIEQLIFTDCPRGQGFDPNKAGLQIKACSNGLNQELQWQLSNICMHHGQAFSISKAPREAIEIEQEWLGKTPDRKFIPDALLESFPIIWSYDFLSDDLFALTRVKYLCLTHDGRTGNFIAHAFIFNCNQLAAYNHNPVALSRSKIFSDTVLNGNEKLSELPDIQIPGNVASNYELLQNKKYQDQFPAMVSALSSAIQEFRPVLVCLSDWHHSLPLVEILLNALPPKLRCRTTFCTYESDRNWKIPNKTGPSTGQLGSRTLLMLYGADTRSFNLRPDEYRSGYSVFNFVGNEFSPLEEPNQYAKFTMSCFLEGELQKLTDFQNLIERFGLENSMELWNSLVPASALFRKQPMFEDLTTAIKSLVQITDTTQRAEIGLELFLPHITLLARTNDSKRLSTLSISLAPLVDFLPKETIEKNSKGFISSIFNLAGNALLNGQICTATALIKASGKYHDDLLLIFIKTFINKLQSNFIQSLTLTDKEEIAALLLDNLSIVEITYDTDFFDQMLILTFHAADEAGQTLKTWESIGEKIVMKKFEGEWDPEKHRLAEELLKYIKTDNCPDASAMIRMKLIEMTKMQDEQLRKILVETAYACSQSKTALKLSEEILKITQEKFSDEELRTIILGQMAEATRETEQGDLYFNAYKKMLEKWEAKKNKIQRQLASLKAAHILCRELIEDVLPWREKDSNQKMQHWHDVILKPYPPVMEILYQELALKLRKSEDLENIIILVEELVTKRQYEATSDSNLIELYDAIIFALPLEPLSQQWSQIFSSSSVKFKTEAEVRLKILNFLRKIEQLSENEDWGIERFPDNDQIWQKNIPLLTFDEKKKIYEWCISKFKTCGLTTSTEAIKLTNLLETLEMLSSDNIAKVMKQFLEDRDPVTGVMAITAFANCGFEFPNQAEHWGEIVGTILDQFDKETQRLFKLHLKRRFHKPGRQYEEILESLLIAARLELPQPKVAPVKVKDTVEGLLSASILSGKATGFANSFSRQLRNLASRLKGIKKSSEPQKKGKE